MFKAYVEQFLAPTLKRGDIVFMDNASVHKAEGIEEAVAARGRASDSWSGRIFRNFSPPPSKHWDARSTLTT
jgi:transposase